MAILQAILTGMTIAMVGTLPRNILYFANMQYFTAVPWAVPLVAIYMWLFWRHLNGYGPPQQTTANLASRIDDSFEMTRLFLLVMLIIAVLAYLRLAPRRKV